MHDLRTTNPQNPENFAVYPRRIGSNRTNPYMKPRGCLDLRRGGLRSYRVSQGELVPTGGELTLYPHVRQAPSGTTNPDGD